MSARRDFLKQLAMVAAACGLDPVKTVEAMQDAPVEEIQRELSAYTIRIGRHVLPMARFAVHQRQQPVYVAWDHEILAGLRSVTFEVQSSAYIPELFDILKAAEAVDVEAQFGLGRSMRFKAFIAAFRAQYVGLGRGDVGTELELKATGPVVWEER